MSAVKLAIVILNWNRKADTLACLQSLPPDSWRIVVDNGSTDGSVEEIRDRFPDVVTLQTGKNLGYAGGNNVGVLYALQHGADLVLLLNNDTVVTEQFLPALLSDAQRHLDIDIFGAYPRLLGSPDLLDHLGGIWNREKGRFDLVGCRALVGFQTDQPLDYVCGCSILIRRAVFERVGLLEERFFLFWEEADFCMRAKRVGCKIGVSYGAHLFHKVSASFTGGTPEKTYFWWRGRYLWIERNCDRAERRRLFRQIFFEEIVHLFKLRCLKGAQMWLERHILCTQDVTEKERKIAQYRAALRGYCDYKKNLFS